VFFDGDIGIAEVATGVHEGDEFGWVFLKGVPSKLLAVLHYGTEILKQRHFAANLLKLCRIEMTVLTDEIRRGLGLGASAIVDELGLKIILVATKTPVADIMLGQVPSCIAEVFDDDFIFDAIFEHAVDLLAQFEWQASDFAVAAGFGLTGLELAGQIIF